jgi:hypothetical protein
MLRRINPRSKAAPDARLPAIATGSKAAVVTSS